MFHACGSLEISTMTDERSLSSYFRKMPDGDRTSNLLMTGETLERLSYRDLDGQLGSKRTGSIPVWGSEIVFLKYELE